MRTGLQGDELNCFVVDKKSYAVFKVVKQFRLYILMNHTKVIVPHLAVRSLFVQKELGEIRSNSVTSLQEHDLEFKPATIVKGKWLYKMMAESQDSEDNSWDNEVELHMVDVCPLFIAPESWYRDLVHYLQEGYLPEHWNPKQRRELQLKSTIYQIIDGVLVRKN